MAPRRRPVRMRCKAGLFSGRVQSQGDPLFSSVVALLHLDGSIADSSSFAKSISSNNSPSISTAQARFGTSSLSFNGGVNQRITVTSSEVIGTSDFTIEMFVRFSELPLAEIGLVRWASGFELRLSDSLYVARTSTDPFSLSGHWSPTIHAWHHIAVCRNANIMRIFVDGSQLGNSADLGNGFSFESGNQQFGATGGLYAMNGWIDEIRVTLADRYSAIAPFAVPAAPFPDA